MAHTNFAILALVQKPVSQTLKRSQSRLDKGVGCAPPSRRLSSSIHSIAVLIVLLVQARSAVGMETCDSCSCSKAKLANFQLPRYFAFERPPPMGLSS